MPSPAHSMTRRILQPADKTGQPWGLSYRCAFVGVSTRGFELIDRYVWRKDHACAYRVLDRGFVLVVEARLTVSDMALGGQVRETDSGRGVGSRRLGTPGRQRALVAILLILVAVGAVLMMVGPFLGRGYVVPVIAGAALALAGGLYQRRVMNELRAAMLRVDPGARVILGQLTRTSPSPAAIAGFHQSSSISRNSWQVGVSIRANSMETWAWDSRTPRRASRISRSVITSVTIDSGYVMSWPRDCLRIEWMDRGTTQWIELALIDLDRVIPGFMNRAAIERATAGLRTEATGSRIE